MDYEKEIPFGAFDSELMHQEIFIPEGFEATIEGDKIILTRIESEDEKIRKELIFYLGDMPEDTELRNGVTNRDVLVWLEKQGSEMKTIGESLGFTTQKECDEYNQMVSELIMSDKIESKFKVGNWYQCTKDFFGKDVTFDKNTAYYCAKEGCLQNEYGCHIAIVKDLYDNFKLWTIQDAKKGDALAAHECVVLFKEIDGLNIKCYCTYHYIGFNPSFYVDTLQNKTAFQPATKEQCDILFQKMKEEGYMWDAEKKELKKIEDEEYNGEDYGIDSLYHAQRILEKTLGNVDGYQTDDGILSHKCAITAVKKLYEQKPADWSEEDEHRVKDTKVIRIIDTVRKRE